MKALFAFFIFYVFLWAGCSPAYERVDVYHDEGYLEASFLVNTQTGQLEGKFLGYNSEGILVEEAQYRNDQLHGPRMLFDENGVLIIEEIYRQGELHGVYTARFPDGSVRYTGTYTHNAMEGSWTYFYPSGQVKEVVQFVNSETKGPFIEYYPNGMVKAEGQYVPGELEHGILTMFDTLGEIERVMHCDFGICRTRWTPDSGHLNFEELWEDTLLSF